MEDERLPWALPEQSARQQAWQPPTGREARPREGAWHTLPLDSADRGYDEVPQADSDAYQSHNVLQVPDEQDPGDPYQLQVPPDGLYGWQPAEAVDPSYPQQGYPAYPGFAGYPGYQDSQGYQTALSSPVYDQQRESVFFSDSHPAFPTDDEDLVCPLGPGMCRSLQADYAAGQLLEDEDDDQPPGSQSHSP